MSRNLMCIVPATLVELEKKGVASHIPQRDLDGYWDTVVTVHPFCSHYSMTSFSKRHVVYEFPARDILKTLWDLPGLARENEISAVKAHDPYWMAVIAMVVAKVCRIPFTIGIYASYELMWKVERRWANGIIKSRLFDKVLARLMFMMANRVQPGSEDAMRWALRSGASKKKTFLVRTGGVDQVHFDKLETRHDMAIDFPILKENHVVLSAGRLVPVRTPLDVISAFINILAWNRDCILLLVGDGPLMGEMEKAVEQFGIKEKVRFLGFQPQDRLRDLLYVADVLLVPLGGSGLVEACLSGTPVVAYDVDWHKELIIEGETGRLVPYRNYVAMAQATIEILSNPEKGMVMGKKARGKAIAQHSLEEVQKTEVKLFEGLLKW